MLRGVVRGGRVCGQRPECLLHVLDRDGDCSRQVACRGGELGVRIRHRVSCEIAASTSRQRRAVGPALWRLAKTAERAGAVRHAGTPRMSLTLRGAAILASSSPGNSSAAARRAGFGVLGGRVPDRWAAICALAWAIPSGVGPIE